MARRRSSLDHDPAALPLPMPLPRECPPPKECTAEQKVGAEQRVGIDEAGRGCLAGPVVAAAVILPALFDLPHLGDSKALSARQRGILAPQIRAVALAWGLGLAWPREIEAVNILQATFLAMARAVKSLHSAPTIPPLPRAPRPRPALLLIDGNKCLPLPVLSRYCPDPLPAQQALVGGDAREPAISAASILAKTFRDQLMEALHKRYPCYDFCRHKGYGTPDHLQALRQHGPCPQHRLTFAGVLPPQTEQASPASPAGNNKGRRPPLQALLW